VSFSVALENGGSSSAIFYIIPISGNVFFVKEGKGHIKNARTRKWFDHYSILSLILSK
jgi:hypothetical protein